MSARRGSWCESDWETSLERCNEVGIGAVGEIYVEVTRFPRVGPMEEKESDGPGHYTSATLEENVELGCVIIEEHSE